MHATAAGYRATLSQHFTEAAQSSVATAVLLVVALEWSRVDAFVSYMYAHASLLVALVPFLFWPVPLSLYVLYHGVGTAAKGARVQRILFFFGLVGVAAAGVTGLYAYSGRAVWQIVFPLVNLGYVLWLLRMLYTGRIDEHVVSDDAARGEVLCVIGVGVVLFLFLVLYLEAFSPYLLFSILVSVTPLLGDMTYRLLCFVGYAGR